MHLEKLNFFRNCPEDLLAVSSLLKAGQAVALPTETVYGLAADALNELAVRQIFEIKGRPLIDPLIVHILDVPQAKALAELSPAAEKLAQAFWPGPLTLVLPKKAIVPALVTAGQSSVALRSPSHSLFRKILEISGLSLAAPSANPFGYISPTRAEHVQRSLKAKAPYILDGGSCEHGLESTILLLSNAQAPRILRPGPISSEAIEAVLGQALSTELPTNNKAQAPLLAPGMLSQHYSPNTQLCLIDYGASLPSEAQTARVFWQKPHDLSHPNTFWLSDDGDEKTAAHNFYHLLQSLDSLGFSRLYWEKAPQGLLTQAINNRLVRAAAKFSKH